MKATAIYNFVPLSKVCYYPKWSDKVSLDIPFKDGEDGIIKVTFKNITPLFTRNGSADKDKKEEYSVHILRPDGKRLYYLPATSIKGMLRSTMDILSFARLEKEDYNDSFFGYRDFGGNTTDGGAYVRKLGVTRDDEIGNVRCGYLRMRNDEFYLSPCIGDFERISYEEIIKKFPNSRKLFNGRQSNWEKNKDLADIAKEWYPHYSEDYRIVCTGNFNKKNADYLFPTRRLKEIPVSSEVKNKFLSVYAPTPGYDGIVQYLREGKELAVFYLVKENDDIDAIGLSKMFRYPYSFSIGKIVEHSQERREGLSLPETIFGSIYEGNALKGRVQVGNALSEEPLADNELLPIVEGVLGKPKASFYPFYLKQKRDEKKAKQSYVKYTEKILDKIEIAGRKVYRSNVGNEIVPLPEGNGNEDTTSKFRAIPAGQIFTCYISVHNLRPIEIGALLSALSLHQTKDAHHHIGLAKGYGYGKLEISSISLKNLHLSKDEYLKAFEEEMDIFTTKQGYGKWYQTEQVKRLIQIHSPHGSDVLRVMSLEEYKLARQNDHFHLLNDDEPSVRVESNHLPSKPKEMTIEEIKEKYQPQIDAITSTLMNKEYNNLSEELRIGSNKSSEKEENRMAYAELYDMLQNRWKTLFGDSTGPTKTFEEKISSVKNIEQLADIIKRWKENHTEELSADDKDNVYNQIVTIKKDQITQARENLNTGNRREREKADKIIKKWSGGYYKNLIASVVGQELAEEWFNDLKTD